MLVSVVQDEDSRVPPRIKFGVPKHHEQHGNQSPHPNVEAVAAVGKHPVIPEPSIAAVSDPIVQHTIPTTILSQLRAIYPDICEWAIAADAQSPATRLNGTYLFEPSSREENNFDDPTDWSLRLAFLILCQKEFF